MTKKNKKESIKLSRGWSVFFKKTLGDVMQTAEHTPWYLTPRKCIAVFLSISQVLVGGPAYPSEIPKTAQLNHPGIQVEFKIPERLGNLEEFHNGISSKTVIYIQDAHDSLEAQVNIAKLIHTLVAKYGVKTVLEEGYEGPVPTDKYFGKIKDPVVRRKVAYFLMDKLRLGGAEYAHITRFNQDVNRGSWIVNREISKPLADKEKRVNDFSPTIHESRSTIHALHDFKLIGADSLLLHRKNIERYQASEQHRAETQTDLQAMDAEIRKMTQLYFTHELKEWMGIKEKLDRKELDLLDYLKRTQTLFLKGVGFEEFRNAYPNISLLLSAAETKDEKILSKLKTSVNYKTLFREINKLEDDYAETHLTQERDRQVFRYYKHIQLLKRLNAIEVTEEEYAAVKESLQVTQTVRIAEFIARESGQSVVLSKLWEKNIQSSIDFYEVARERDGSIQSRLKEYAASNDLAPIILVYGGFHKGRVKELLERNSFSYAVVSPKITSMSTKHQDYYRQLMRMGYISMALPRLVATATTPPRILDFAAISAKREVRMQALLNQLAQIAAKEKSDSPAAAVGDMDLALSRSEVRSNILGNENSNPQSTRRVSFSAVRSEMRSASEDEALLSQDVTANSERALLKLTGTSYFQSKTSFPSTADSLRISLTFAARVHSQISRLEQPDNKPLKVLVFGAGSGLDAMMVLNTLLRKKVVSGLQLDLVDIDPDAIRMAQRNLEHQAAELLSAKAGVFNAQGDLSVGNVMLRTRLVSIQKEFESLDAAYDLILWNAPETMQDLVYQHVSDNIDPEYRLASRAELMPFSDLVRITREFGRRLTPQGTIFMEFQPERLDDELPSLPDSQYPVTLGRLLKDEEVDYRVVKTVFDDNAFIKERRLIRMVHKGSVGEMSASEVRTKSPQIETVKAASLAIDSRMPAWYFLKAFGFDPQAAPIIPDSEESEWGHVSLLPDKDSLDNARQSALRIMVSEKFVGLKGLRPHIDEIMAYPETNSLREFYLLTHQGVPAALVWPLPGKKATLYYSLLTRGNGDFFRTELTKSAPGKVLNAEISDYVRRHHSGPSFDVIENPYYDDSPTIHPEIHVGLDGPHDGLSFTSIYIPGEASTRTLLSVLNQIDFSRKSVIELGSGNGRVLVAAVQQGAAQATGYETSELGVQNTLAWAALNDVHNVHAMRENLSEDYRTADIYLLNSPNIVKGEASTEESFRSQTYEKALLSNIEISEGDFKEVMRKIARAANPKSKIYLRVEASEERLVHYLSGTGLSFFGELKSPLSKTNVQGMVYVLGRTPSLISSGLPNVTEKRSEVRTIPEDVIGLMPPLETVDLQPLDEFGRKTVLHLNKSSFAEHFAEGSKNLAALREALTKNYERRPNQRSLFIDLPEPFEVNGRRWVSVQLKGTVFDSRQKISDHSEEAYKALGEEEHAKGFVDDRLDVFQDGRIENIGAQPSPDGAMTLDKAIREFALSASINENLELASKNLRAPGAIAYGEFPMLSFNGQPLAFVALGIDDEMTGAVTRLNESGDTVAADVTHALWLLHQANYSHPFLHGGNLSSNVARTKWYVHDLDASRLFDAQTDTLSFAAAAQVRDFFYIIEKYVFDRYLLSSNPEASSWGFRNLESIVGAYFPERKRAGPLWQLETGYLVRGDPAHIDGGIEEVVEHYLQQLKAPGKSVLFRDILFPRHLARPLLAAADLGMYIQSRLRTKGFNDRIRRSEMRAELDDYPDISKQIAELGVSPDVWLKLTAKKFWASVYKTGFSTQLVQQNLLNSESTQTEDVDPSELPNPDGPVVGLFANAFNGAQLAALFSNQSDLERANFILIPPFGSLFRGNSSEEGIYTTQGLFFDPKRGLVAAYFKKPVRIHALASAGVEPSGLNAELEDLGIPLLAVNAGLELTHDKSEFGDLLKSHGVLTPEFILLEPGARVREIERAITDTKDEQIAMKPVRGGSGTGAKLFSLPQGFDEAVRHGVQITAHGETAMIQKRIHSQRWKNLRTGQRYDVNLRILTTWSENDLIVHEKNIVVRYQQDYGRAVSGPVSVDKGAKANSLQGFFKDMGYSTDEAEQENRKIMLEIQGVLARASRVLEERTRQLKGNSPVDQPLTGLVGWDLIYSDEGRQWVVLEANMGPVGGIEVLETLEPLGEKGTVIRPVLRYLAQSAKKYQASPRINSTSQNLQPLAAISDPVTLHNIARSLMLSSQYGLAEILTRMGLSLDEKNERLWKTLGDILVERGRRVDAIHAYVRALEIDPDSIPAVRGLRAVAGMVFARYGVAGFFAFLLGVSFAVSSVVGMAVAPVTLIYWLWNVGVEKNILKPFAMEKAGFKMGQKGMVVLGGLLAVPFSLWLGTSVAWPLLGAAYLTHTIFWWGSQRGLVVNNDEGTRHAQGGHSRDVRSEVRVTEEGIFSLAEVLVGDKSLAFMPGDELAVAQTMFEPYTKLNALAHKEPAEILEIFHKALTVLWQVSQGIMEPAAYFDTYWAAAVRQAADQYLHYEIDFRTALPKSMPVEEQAMLNIRMLEYAALANDYEFHGVAAWINELQDLDQDSATHPMSARMSIGDLDDEAQEILSKGQTIAAAFNVIELVWGTGIDGQGNEREKKERDQIREYISHAKAFAVGPKKPDQVENDDGTATRSEVRSTDITHPDEDDALAREYEGMQTFEAEAELQRQKHASSPKAFLLKPRDPAAERQHLESKFRDVVFIRDWIGIQFLPLMTSAKQPADWKTLDRPVSKTYPAQAALDGIQLAAQMKGDATVDFLFRVENKKIVIELRNAETHRRFGNTAARDFIRQRFTPAGQELLRSLTSGKAVNEIVEEAKMKRSEVRAGTVRGGIAEKKLVESLVRLAKIGGESESYKNRIVLFDKDMQFQSRRQDKRVDLTPAVLSSLQAMTRLARRNDAELEAKIYLKKGRTVGLEYPDDDTKFIIVRSLSSDEVEVTENFNFYFLIDHFLSRLYEGIQQKIPEDEILQDLRNLGFVMQETKASIEVFSINKRKRIAVIPRQLEQLTSLEEVRDLLMDIARAQYAVNPWWSSVRLDKSAQVAPEHDEVLTVHTHPRDNPSPPSAFVRGKDKFGDIYHAQFSRGEIMGIILDTPEGDRLLLFHEPDLTAQHEAAYQEALELYWNARDAKGQRAAEWKPETQTYTTSKNWKSVLTYLDQNLAMTSEKPIWLSKRVSVASADSLFRGQSRLSLVQDTSPSEAGRLTGDGSRHQLVVESPGDSVNLMPLRSEMRQTETISRVKPTRVRGQERLNLKQVLEKTGPTKIFVDVSAPVASPVQTVTELARLDKAGVEVVIYNLGKAQNDKALVKILDTFSKSLFHRVTGGWNDALAGFEHARDEMNLVHYSESETDAKGKAPAWAEKRVVYLAGKSGAAAYGLSQVGVLRKAVEASEINEPLLALLEIAEKNGFYFVSEAKSAWMRLQLEAESIVAFAQAA